jgi:dTMP kinase
VFVTFEGVDGSGKSTQADLLKESLEKEGRTVVATREPGGTPLGEQVRGVLLDPGPVARGPVADALLFNAARSQLVPEVIRPALARGDVVVSDRYATSTMAYQGYGSGVDREVLLGIERLVTGGLVTRRRERERGTTLALTQRGRFLGGGVTAELLA